MKLSSQIEYFCKENMEFNLIKVSLANFEKVEHKYINGIDLCNSGPEWEKPNKLCSRYLGWEQELTKSFPAIREGNKNPNKYSCCLGTRKPCIPFGKYLGT